jgi:hypothetical protein
MDRHPITTCLDRTFAAEIGYKLEKLLVLQNKHQKSMTIINYNIVSVITIKI